MDIIWGYGANPHITAQQLRDTYVGIFGDDTHILDVGSKMAATVISATKVQIADGVLIAQGCTACINYGQTESLTIQNGTQGMLRKDLIVAQYMKSTGFGVESMSLAVKRGTPAASSPALPAYTTGSIADGDTLAEFPLYVVNLDGINITSVQRLVDVVSVPSMVEEVQNGVDAIVTRTDRFYVFRFPNISTSDDNSAIGAALQSILTRGLGDITFQCFIFRTGAWQLNGFGSVRSGDARATFVNGSNGQIKVVSRTTTSALTVIRSL